MSSSALELVSEHACFGGVQRYYQHVSSVIGLPMRFSVSLPPQARQGAVPAVMYLAGLTCNEETFMVKGGAQRVAAALGLALIAPDTSPRGAGVPGEQGLHLGEALLQVFGIGQLGFFAHGAVPQTGHHSSTGRMTASLQNHGTSAEGMRARMIAVLRPRPGALRLRS